MPKAIFRIDTATGRRELEPRREPYWSRVEAGAYLGYRKLGDSTGTWVARWRADTGEQKYHALGSLSDYDAARKQANDWFEQCKGGAPEVIDVAEACRKYVAELRAEGRKNTAGDADGRFRRLIYDTNFGRIKLPALRAGHLTDWRNGQIIIDDEDDPDALRRAKDSSNRNLGSLKAALNTAHKRGFAASTAAWDRVEKFKGAERRRERFLTLAERKAVLEKATPELARFIRAALLTAARPGEVAALTVGDLDPHLGLLSINGNELGKRTVQLPPTALKHLKNCAGKRNKEEPLVERDDGQPWTRAYWRDGLQAARTEAGLGNEVVMYSFRHVAISEMLVSGIDVTTVARLAGTSVEMINRNYGHLVKDGLVAKLARVKLL